MTAPRDPDRLIDAFLAEGQTDLPEQVYDEVRAEIEHTNQRTFFGPWNSPAFLRFGALATTVAVVALAVVIGLQLGAPSNPPGGPGPALVGVSEEVTSGDFRLTITSPSATWSSDEAIEVDAKLEYLGNAAETTLWGSGSGPIGFGLVEVSGDRSMGAAFTADCAAHSISADAPISSPFVKSGGYSPDEPNAAFYEAFFAEPDFLLPPGEWQVTASATFDDGDTCTASPIVMAATITLTIDGSAEPSAKPTVPPSESPSVAPSPEPVPTDLEFTCGLASGTTIGGEAADPALQSGYENGFAHLTDITLTTMDGFDRITFTYDGDSIPGYTIESAHAPFTRDPSGLPMDVGGAQVFQIAIHGGTKFTDEYVSTYDGPLNFEPGYEQIVQLVESGDFEATNVWYLGTTGGECLRVFYVSDPTRLIIDVQH